MLCKTFAMILNDTEIIYFLLKNFLTDYLKTDCTKDAPLKNNEHSKKQLLYKCNSKIFRDGYLFRF